MDPAVKLKRHTQLWENADANARRVAIAGLIFAALILVNVVEPYFKMTKEDELLPQWRAELASLETEQASLAQRKEDLQKIEMVLGQIEQSVKDLPWRSDIDKLIQTCRGGCPANVQDRADETIINIADKMKKISVEPLRAVIRETGMEGELAGAADNVEAAINAWKDQRLRKVWYATVQSKERAAATVASDVQAETQRAEATRGNLDEATTQQLASLTADIGEQQVNLQARETIIVEDIKAKEEKIRAAMGAALPAWADGLFTVKSMVLLYPWILVGIGVWMVGNGLIAGQHYRGMADAEGWTAIERGDPLLSSPWTLTWRGAAGGAVTFSYYSASLGALGYCIYRSAHPAEYEEWSSSTQGALAANFPVELSFALLAVALLAVGIALRPRPT